MSKDLVQERPLPETDRHFLCPYPSPVSDTLSLVKHLLDQAERRLFAVHTWPLLDPYAYLEYTERKPAIAWRNRPLALNKIDS